MNIKYPLIGKDNCTKEEAKMFEILLAEKCQEFKNSVGLLSNKISPEFCIVKTNKDKSFGVILSNEIRYSQKESWVNKLFKTKVCRISYNPNNFESREDFESFIKYNAHLKLKKLQALPFKNLKAYTLDENNQLQEIASMSYYTFSEILKSNGKTHKVAYIDGVAVKNDFRRNGIAKTMQELLHLLLTAEGVDTITMDVVKNVTWNKDRGDYDIEPKSNYFKLLESMGYEVESINKMHDPFAWTTPIKKNLNNNVILKRVILTGDEFETVEDNFKSPKSQEEEISQNQIDME